MNQQEALRRLERLEAEARREDLRPELERLAAEHDLDPDDILAEAHRIRQATEGMTRGQMVEWVADDLVASTGMEHDEALALARSAYDGV